MESLVPRNVCVPQSLGMGSESAVGRVSVMSGAERGGESLDSERLECLDRVQPRDPVKTHSFRQQPELRNSVEVFHDTGAVEPGTVCLDGGSLALETHCGDRHHLIELGNHDVVSLGNKLTVSHRSSPAIVTLDIPDDAKRSEWARRLQELDAAEPIHNRGIRKEHIGKGSVDTGESLDSESSESSDLAQTPDFVSIYNLEAQGELRHSGEVLYETGDVKPGTVCFDAGRLEFETHCGDRHFLMELGNHDVVISGKKLTVSHRGSTRMVTLEIPDGTERTEWVRRLKEVDAVEPTQKLVMEIARKLNMLIVRTETIVERVHSLEPTLALFRGTEQKHNALHAQTHALTNWVEALEPTLNDIRETQQKHDALLVQAELQAKSLTNRVQMLEPTVTLFRGTEEKRNTLHAQTQDLTNWVDVLEPTLKLMKETQQKHDALHVRAEAQAESLMKRIQLLEQALLEKGSAGQVLKSDEVAVNNKEHSTDNLEKSIGDFATPQKKSLATLPALDLSAMKAAQAPLAVASPPLNPHAISPRAMMLTPPSRQPVTISQPPKLQGDCDVQELDGTTEKPEFLFGALHNPERHELLPLVPVQASIPSSQDANVVKETMKGVGRFGGDLHVTGQKEQHPSNPLSATEEELGRLYPGLTGAEQQHPAMERIVCDSAPLKHERLDADPLAVPSAQDVNVLNTSGDGIGLYGGRQHDACEFQQRQANALWDIDEKLQTLQAGPHGTEQQVRPSLQAPATTRMLWKGAPQKYQCSGLEMELASTVPVQALIPSSQDVEAANESTQDVGCPEGDLHVMRQKEQHRSRPLSEITESLEKLRAGLNGAEQQLWPLVNDAAGEQFVYDIAPPKHERLDANVLAATSIRELNVPNKVGHGTGSFGGTQHDAVENEQYAANNALRDIDKIRQTLQADQHDTEQQSWLSLAPSNKRIEWENALREIDEKRQTRHDISAQNAKALENAKVAVGLREGELDRGATTFREIQLRIEERLQKLRSGPEYESTKPKYQVCDAFDVSVRSALRPSEERLSTHVQDPDMERAAVRRSK